MDADFSDTPSARLCGSCGMCCDGVLFHAVELQKGDNARQLASLGIKLRSKKGVSSFLQPCSAHRDVAGACSCAIYEQRPLRCKNFDCQQLRGLLSGTITETMAREKVQQARSQVEQIHGLLDRITPTNPNRSLAHRVANALTLPPGVERGALHEELETAMKELESLLQKEFRVS